MIYDIWFLIFDIWYMIIGTWMYMIFDVWYMTFDILYLICGIWLVVIDIRWFDDMVCIIYIYMYTHDIWCYSIFYVPYMMYDDVFDDIWYRIYDDILPLMTYDDIWWHMMIYDDIWWYMIIYFDIWLHMIYYFWDMIWYDLIWYDMTISACWRGPGDVLLSQSWTASGIKRRCFRLCWPISEPHMWAMSENPFFASGYSKSLIIGGLMGYSSISS